MTFFHYSLSPICSNSSIPPHSLLFLTFSLCQTLHFSSPTSFPLPLSSSFSVHQPTFSFPVSLSISPEHPTATDDAFSSTPRQSAFLLFLSLFFAFRVPDVLFYLSLSFYSFIDTLLSRIRHHFGEAVRAASWNIDRGR